MNSERCQLDSFRTALEFQPSTIRRTQRNGFHGFFDKDDGTLLQKRGHLKKKKHIFANNHHISFSSGECCINLHLPSVNRLWEITRLQPLPSTTSAVNLAFFKMSRSCDHDAARLLFTNQAAQNYGLQS